jgi:hypothetical protein
VSRVYGGLHASQGLRKPRPLDAGCAQNELIIWRLKFVFLSISMEIAYPVASGATPKT